MATSSITHRTPTRPQTRPTAPHAPDPAAVLSYLAAGHSNAEAAAHFGIHERSVRRIKQRQAERTTRMLPCMEDRPSSVVARHARIYAAPTFPETSDDIAGDHTSWRCPMSGELLPVIPGSRRKAWEAERRAAHARHIALLLASPDYVTSPDRTPAGIRFGNGPDTSAITSATTLGSHETGGQVRAEEEDPTIPSPDRTRTFDVPAPLDPMPRERPPTPDYPVDPLDPTKPATIDPTEVKTPGRMQVPAPIVMTRVVRVPVEVRRGGLVEWLNDRPGVRNQLLAVAVFLALVALCAVAA